MFWNSFSSEGFTCLGGGGLLLLLGLVTVSGCRDEPDTTRAPEATVRTFLHALALQDVDAALALLDEDFVFRNHEGSFAVTKEFMPTILAWDEVADGRPEIREMAVVGDSVRVRLVERNRFTELLDLQPWRVEALFIVRDGRITEEVVREVAGEGPTFDERFHRALRPVRRWAVEHRPAEARELFDDGKVVRYDSATARRLIALIESYQEHTVRERKDPN